MSRRRTDFRALKARRDAALARPELRAAPRRAAATDEALIREAIAAGRVTRLPAGRRRP